MTWELALVAYVIVTGGFGIPYSIAAMKLNSGDINLDPVDYLFMAVLSAILWPGVLWYNLTHRQDIKDSKRAKVLARNSKLIALQTEQHKLAIAERKARHRAALDQFDAHFPKTPIKRADLGPNPFRPIHFTSGPCDLMHSQTTYLSTFDEKQVTCPECRRALSLYWH